MEPDDYGLSLEELASDSREFGALMARQAECIHSDDDPNCFCFEQTRIEKDWYR